MGYYVETMGDETAFSIPAKNLPEALKRMKTKIEELQNNSYNITYGGLEGDSVAEILSGLGFEFFEEEDGSLTDFSYYGKSYKEEVFLSAIADLCEGVMAWRGEQGELWRWTFGPEGFKEQYAHITWKDTV